MNDTDLYYLRAIQRRLEEYNDLVSTDFLYGNTSLLGIEALADEQDWLAEYINRKMKSSGGAS